MGKRIAFPYLACLVFRSAPGFHVVAVEFACTCPGFPYLEAQFSEFPAESGKVKPLHPYKNIIHSLFYLFPVGFAYIL